ncbi:MAG: DUF4855 domain-containing protein [Armatimonadetes bacterium]|nr:DUF4855 domain-containing protein [Armatimonadota bacterium]
MNSSYFPPGSPSAMKARHIVLIYNGHSHRTWKMEDLKPYVAYLNPDGTPRHWFFDTFLMLPLTAQSGNCFYPGFSPTPSNRADWLWYLDSKLFGGETHLPHLNEAVKLLQKEMEANRYRAKVILTVPYPDPRRTDFGDVDGDGQEGNLSRAEDRYKAVDWYVKEATARWKKAAFSHLELIGWYWLEEQVSEGDRDLLPKVGKLVRDQGKRFFWIPYFNSGAAAEWKALGFDCAIYQPNYFFGADTPASRIEEAAKFARENGMGVEIECDGRFAEPVFRMKYKAYLDGGMKYGYMRDAICGYYEGGGALLQAYQSKDPAVRALYNRTYKFVKGTYKPEHFPVEEAPAR